MAGINNDGLEMQTDDESMWSSNQSISDSSQGHDRLPGASRTTTTTSSGSPRTAATRRRDDYAHLPALLSDSDSDDETTWNNTLTDYSSGSSDTSDGDYVFNGNISDASDDSSIAGDDDEYGVFEMLSHHFDVFNNFVPAFFGVSLQMLYARIMENITMDEEKESPTPQHILDLLPAMEVNVAHIASNMSCCICFCDYVLNEDLLELPCSHLYHKSCILDWLKIKCTCPTCRLDLTKNITDSDEPPPLIDFNIPYSSSENSIYNMDRENIYDSSSDNHSGSNENISDVPSSSSSNSINNNHSSHHNFSILGSDLRTSSQNSQNTLRHFVTHTDIGGPSNSNLVNSHSNSLESHSNSANSHSNSVNSHSNSTNSHSHSSNSHSNSVNSHSNSVNSHSNSVNSNTVELTNTDKTEEEVQKPRSTNVRETKRYVRETEIW